MLYKDENLAWIATGDTPIYLIPKMANRHGLVAGATGTGKTVTVKVMAETFSDMGTPVFISDVKGDVSGMIVPGDREGLQKFVDKCQVPSETFECRPFPSRFFDVYGEKGISVRTTISNFGPDLLSRLLELTDVQSGVLNIVFRVADDNGWLLIDLKDLKAMVKYVSDNAKDIRDTYGNVSSQTVGAIQRALLKLEDAGGDIFFGEPELDINDWIQLNGEGRGYINILECAKLVQSPLLYSTFLLWMLSEIYEKLPEAGDLDKPKMVFFFDEAHLLFEDAPKALMQKVEQVVRLIRSKGVGVYFISQKPADIPENVLAQLGNRIQHALRAYTPQEQKAVKAAAQSFRVNPDFDTETVITELGTGQALVSFLDEEGVPSIVQKARILPPQSSMNMADEQLVLNTVAMCPLTKKYINAVDRESAYEILNKPAASLNAVSEEADNQSAKTNTEAKVMTAEELEKEKEKAVKQAMKERDLEEKEKARIKREEEKIRREEERIKKEEAKRKSAIDKIVTKTINSATGTIGRSIGREISRGILGGIKNVFK